LEAAGLGGAEGFGGCGEAGPFVGGDHGCVDCVVGEVECGDCFGVSIHSANCVEFRGMGH